MKTRSSHSIMGLVNVDGEAICSPWKVPDSVRATLEIRLEGFTTSAGVSFLHDVTAGAPRRARVSRERVILFIGVCGQVFPNRKRLDELKREGVLEFDFSYHGGEKADIIDRYLEVFILGIEAPSYVVL